MIYLSVQGVGDGSLHAAALDDENEKSDAEVWQKLYKNGHIY